MTRVWKEFWSHQRGGQGLLEAPRPDLRSDGNSPDSSLWHTVTVATFKFHGCSILRLSSSCTYTAACLCLWGQRGGSGDTALNISTDKLTALEPLRSHSPVSLREPKHLFWILRVGIWLYVIGLPQVIDFEGDRRRHLKSYQNKEKQRQKTDVHVSWTVDLHTAA